MSNNTTPDAKRIVTGQVRLSYAHLLNPRAPQGGGTPKYSVTLLIPKSDIATYQKMQAAIQAAVNEAVSGKWNGTKPAQIPIPVHDGDGLKQNGEPFLAECKGHWVITASSEQKPEVVDINCNPIIDATQIYSGMYARVSIRFFGYFNGGKKGIGAGLGNVQKTADGEPLSGTVSAEKDFGADAAPWNQPSFQTPQQQYPQYPQPPQPGYQQPSAPQAYRPNGAPQIDPITGRPIGGVMGL